MLIVGRLYGSQEVSVVQVEGESIVSVRAAGEAPPSGPGVVGGAALLLAPALLDIQVNGFGGHDLNSAETRAEDVVAVVEALRATGVGLFCPTVCTNHPDAMLSCLRAIAEACKEQQIAASIAGVHVEGPYISPEDGPRGAHPLEHVRDPDWDEFRRFQDAAGGRIRIVSLAPERPGALPFIERLAAEGVIPAIAHTDATPADIHAAISAGARLSTHLGNGSHAVLPRHPNYIWEQLAADELWASIIPDGHHLPPSVVKCMVRAKGIERTILVSDAVRYAGLEPGEYRSGDQTVELTPDGKVRLKGTPYLAGSALELSSGVANAVRFAGVSLPDALKMATLNPARLLGIEERYGTIEPGKEASLLLFEWDRREQSLAVRGTFVRGRQL